MSAVRAPAGVPRLLAGPAFTSGSERLPDHESRLGPLPAVRDGGWLLDALDASGLLGKGGAAFPVAQKWRSVAARAAGKGAAVLVNGAEGEPLSAKDRALMSLRPHLVLDGAELGAAVVGASEIVVYVGAAHTAARAAMKRAIAERALRVPVRLLLAPDRYVAGEESAAVHAANDGDARPVTTPPRPFDRGIGGRPTLVQNVESLAHAALIARFGPDWYAALGRGETPGTTLVTLTDPVGRRSVREVELGVTIGELAALTGSAATRADVQGVLLGGYFGGWRDADEAWSLPLDPAALRRVGSAIGAGVVSFLGRDTCPVRATARIADYLAGESAAQCGPCVYGLRAIADATIRLTRLRPRADDLVDLERWAGLVRNRGACRHPDGAAGLIASALETFGAEFDRHQRAGECTFEARHVARPRNDGRPIMERVA